VNLTLTDEQEAVLARRRLVRWERILREARSCRLPFNGELSEDEKRMAQQCTFSGPASWDAA
jgi:hypothetical protein